MLFCFGLIILPVCNTLLFWFFSVLIPPQAYFRNKNRKRNNGPNVQIYVFF